jgi:hypothetical protein
MLDGRKRLRCRVTTVYIGPCLEWLGSLNDGHEHMFSCHDSITTSAVLYMHGLLRLEDRHSPDRVALHSE